MPSIARKLIHGLFSSVSQGPTSSHASTLVNTITSSGEEPAKKRLVASQVLTQAHSHLLRLLRAPLLRSKAVRVEQYPSPPDMSPPSITPFHDLYPSLESATTSHTYTRNGSTAGRSCTTDPQTSTPDLCHWPSPSIRSTFTSSSRAATPTIPSTAAFSHEHHHSHHYHHTLPGTPLADAHRFVKLGGRKLDRKGSLQEMGLVTDASYVDLGRSPTHYYGVEPRSVEVEVELLPRNTFACPCYHYSSSSYHDHDNLDSNIINSLDWEHLPSATVQFPFSIATPHIAHHLEMIEGAGWTIDDETGRLRNTRTLADFGIEVEEGEPLPDGVVRLHEDVVRFM